MCSGQEQEGDRHPVGKAAPCDLSLVPGSSPTTIRLQDLLEKSQYRAAPSTLLPDNGSAGSCIKFPSTNPTLTFRVKPLAALSSCAHVYHVCPGAQQGRYWSTWKLLLKAKSLLPAGLCFWHPFLLFYPCESPTYSRATQDDQKQSSGKHGMQAMNAVATGTGHMSLLSLPAISSIEQ